MNRHHANCVRRRRRIAFYLDIVASEPGEEAIERGDFLGFERQRAGDQFGDRIARRLAKAMEQLAAPIDRTRQDRLEEP